MSRKNKPGNRRPQHSRLAANQEVRRAVQAGKPEPFGIRRKLSYTDDDRIRDHFYDLLIDNEEIARLIEPRNRLHLTIMRKRELDSQLARGLVVGYEYGRNQARIQHEIKETGTHTLDVEFKEARIMKQGRAVVLLVDGEKMREEVRGTMKALASIGLRGALRNEGFKPHITLGESDTPMSRIEKIRVLDAVNEAMAVAIPELPGTTPDEVSSRLIHLDPLEFYPQPRDVLS